MTQRQVRFETPIGYFWVFFGILTVVSVGLAIAALLGAFDVGTSYFFYAEAIGLIFLTVLHWVKLI